MKVEVKQFLASEEPPDADAEVVSDDLTRAAFLARWLREQGVATTDPLLSLRSPDVAFHLIVDDESLLPIKVDHWISLPGDGIVRVWDPIDQLD